MQLNSSLLSAATSHRLNVGNGSKLPQICAAENNLPFHTGNIPCGSPLAWHVFNYSPEGSDGIKLDKGRRRATGVLYLEKGLGGEGMGLGKGKEDKGVDRGLPQAPATKGGGQ